MYTARTLRGWTGGGPDLVRDDYGGYLSYDTTLAAVQQCQPGPALPGRLRHSYDQAVAFGSR